MKTFSLSNLSEQELNIILNGLSMMPFRDSAPIIQKIQEQAQSQVSKPSEDGDAQAEVVSH